MKTPICDFIQKYSKSNALRLHMPGHKGCDFLGLERLDVTEFDGADSLFSPSGIIKESEKNASVIFDAHTFYSTEGSSLSIRAMLFLCYKYAISQGKKPLVLAGRNAHKSFLSAVSLLGLEVDWLFGGESYLSCNITANDLEDYLINSTDMPFALYITTPDYLGNCVDVKAIANVCKKYGVLLLVDEAHGAHFTFHKELPPTAMESGASMCTQSFHKTLPALTQSAVLHTSNCEMADRANAAIRIFQSSSPSYLLMASMDSAEYNMKKYGEKRIGSLIKIIKRGICEA